MKRKTETTHRTIQRYSSMVEHRDMDAAVTDSSSVIGSKSKGSRLKTEGRKANQRQGWKQQGIKGVTRVVIDRECPAGSYVSSFLIQNFAGFLSGRILFS